MGVLAGSVGRRLRDVCAGRLAGFYKGEGGLFKDKVRGRMKGDYF